MGEISTENPYIIIDDTVTMGGTLAMLRSHIVQNGGTVICATALAHKNGHHVPFAVDDRTVEALEDIYGDGLNEFWKERIGHDVTCVTQAEAELLVRFGDQECEGCADSDERLQRLRDRLSQAAAKAE